MEWLAQGPRSIFGIDARIVTSLYADDCVIVAGRRECPNPVRGSAVCPNKSYRVLLIGENDMCEVERMQCDVVPADVHLALPGRIKTARTVSFINEHLVEVGLCESKASTFLDAGMATNFVFKLDCCTREVMERANAANVSAGLKKCVNTLNGECDFDFYRVACSTFDRNLRLVDSRLPQVLANALLRYFLARCSYFMPITGIRLEAICSVIRNMRQRRSQSMTMG